MIPSQGVYKGLGEALKWPMLQFKLLLCRRMVYNQLPSPEFCYARNYENAHKFLHGRQQKILIEI